MKKQYSKKVQFSDGEGSIHGFTTGMVSVKTKFRKAQGGALFSKLNFLLDSQFTEFMPIWVWVIDHPEGVFVIDTGENVRVKEEGYFKQEGPILNFINTRSFTFRIEPEEEVGPQLQKLGYQQKDLKSVILTHLHLDHFDGLHYFDETDIFVNQYEWEHPSFALKSLYPKWFDPKMLELKNAPGLPFEGSISLTESKEILMVATPGHTKGHCSILLKTKGKDYFLAGDTTYDQRQLIQEEMAGGHQDFKAAKKTFKAIKTYAAGSSLVYLPSHDAAALERLEKDISLEGNLL